MEILKVIFINFSRIYSGLGKTTLEIDFSDLKNKIYLFVGENGSGKTSIMRSLHPFAYNNGLGDTTANSDFIIEGKDGKKVIIIANRDNIYEISHIYSRKKDGHLEVKSFIRENEIELNDSGTVRTFEQIVLNKLGLDKSFLGLLSLGNTVDGFVKYTSANRKKFATQIFSQLGIYSKYYKTVSAKVRSTKSVLSNITAKLERYKSYQVDDLEMHKLELEKHILDLKKELTEISVNMGSTLQTIKDNEEFIQSYDQKRSRFNELLTSIDAIKAKISTRKDLVVLENDYEDILSRINDLKIIIAGIESSISSELDLQDSKTSTMKSMKETLSRMSKNMDFTELTELKSSLEKDLSAIASRNLPERQHWSKDDLVKINIYLDELLGMCVDLVNEVDDLSVIPSILEDYKKDENVDQKISKSLEELTYAFNQEKVLQMSKDLLDNMHIRRITPTCSKKDSCLYIKFYHDVMNVISKDIDDVNEQLRERQKDIHQTEDMLRASSIIKRLYKFISMNDKYFDLPTELFDRSQFILMYLKERKIYDTDYLTYLIELEETYEQKDKLTKQIVETKEKLDTLQNTTQAYNQLSEEVAQLEIGIQDISNVIEKQRKDLNYNTAQLQELENVSSEVKKQLELLKELNQLRTEFNSVKSEIVVMESRMGNIEQSRTQYKSYELDKARVESSISEAETQLQNTHVLITSITDLQSEQRDLMEKYSIDKLILEAVSPTEGIPIDFINYYIKEQMIGKVNDLLDTVYHGRLRLIKSKTIIDEDEFTIPYMKRSTLVNDISNASDGERAIISLAFSLVLLDITSGPYNILLLDEMDTALDTESRAKYIELLDQFMKTIDAKQLFLISHNSMFDVYPVTVLKTSKAVINMSNADILDLTA